jgi:hypothetical protein
MLEQGTFMDTEEKEYRGWPAINYSSLADFNESQDHALMEKPAKSYFEEGTAFELLIEDRAKGTTKFQGRFFLANVPGAMPDELAGWIDGEEDLDSKYKYNLDGARNKQCERKHAWLDECRDNPGKMPMGTDQMAMLNKMVDNFMKMQPLAVKGTGNTLAEILPVADFQIPIVWYLKSRTGSIMRKKALIDCMIETETTIYVFDIKTAADVKRFLWMLKDKYWIQQAHYTEALKAIFPEKSIVWLFLVSSKAAPYISQPFCVDPICMATYAVDAYCLLCERYQEWLDEGRPPKGWKRLEEVEVFFR